MVLATRTSAPNTSLAVIRPKPRPDSPTASEISVIMLKSELPHEASNPVSKKAARVHQPSRERGGQGCWRQRDNPDWNGHRNNCPLGRSGRPTIPQPKEKPAALGAAGGLEPIDAGAGANRNDQPALASSARQQHAVDHVNNAVRLEHVLNRDPGGIALGVADGQRLTLEFDGELFAFDGLELGLAAVLVGCLPQVLDRR